MNVDSFVDSIVEKYEMPERALRSLWHRVETSGPRLTILAGPPGVGKTTLIRELARFRGARLHTEVVAPDWYSPGHLFGGWSSLELKFRRTKFVEHLWEAALPENSSTPYYFCLEEFNLAHPEQYLAPLLVAMEQDDVERRITLATEGSAPWDVYATVPDNVRFFATVNTDATTRPLSPKVLSRAMYIPLLPEETHYENYLNDMLKGGVVYKPLRTAFREATLRLVEVARAGGTLIGFRTIKQAWDYVATSGSGVVELNEEGEIADEDRKRLLEELDYTLARFHLACLPGSDGQRKAYADSLTETEVDRMLSDIIKHISNERTPSQLPLTWTMLGRIGSAVDGQHAYL